MADVSLKLNNNFAILLLLHHTQQIYYMEAILDKETVKLNISGPLPGINQRSHL